MSTNSYAQKPAGIPFFVINMPTDTNTCTHAHAHAHTHQDSQHVHARLRSGARSEGQCAAVNKGPEGDVGFSVHHNGLAAETGEQKVAENCRTSTRLMAGYVSLLLFLLLVLFL